MNDWKWHWKCYLEKSGISVSEISDIGNNNKMPSIMTLELIAHGSGIDVKELYKLKK